MDNAGIQSCKVEKSHAIDIDNVISVSIESSVLICHAIPTTEITDSAVIVAHIVKKEAVSNGNINGADIKPNIIKIGGNKYLSDEHALLK